MMTSQSLRLKETAIFEVVSNDDVSDCVEDELDVGGVGCTGEVGVNLLLVFPLVQVLKLHLDVGGAVVVIVGA